MSVTEEHRGGNLNRSVGFYGLMFVSLGSIIGSGWLLGALTAAEIAGPASIISWVLAAAMLATLALVYAELGATYPVAGGSGRFPYYSHGPIAGFIGGWAAWVQAVFIAPIEVLAAITYINSVSWVNEHFAMLNSKGLLNTRGVIVAIILMLLFTGDQPGGRQVHVREQRDPRDLEDGRAVPGHRRHRVAELPPGQLHRRRRLHAPRLARRLRGPARRASCSPCRGSSRRCSWPARHATRSKDLSRAILIAMGIGALLYTLLQVVMIAGARTRPTSPTTGTTRSARTRPTTAPGTPWPSRSAPTWLAVILIIDAVISPSGTGIVYLGTSARLSYALGEEREMPGALASTNSRGVPVVSIIVALVVGVIALRPVQELGQARQRGDRGDGCHVRHGPRGAGGAPPQ